MSCQWIPVSVGFHFYSFYIRFIVYFPLLCASAITWYKDGRPLTSAAGLTLLKRGQVLEIERAQLSDAGTYRCVAVNLAGDAEISVSLQVYGEIYSWSRINITTTNPVCTSGALNHGESPLSIFLFFMQCLRSFLAEAAQ